MGQKVSQYPTTLSAFANVDLFDVSKKISSGPDVWESEKVTYLTLATSFISMNTGYIPVATSAHKIINSYVTQQTNYWQWPADKSIEGSDDTVSVKLKVGTSITQYIAFGSTGAATINDVFGTLNIQTTSSATLGVINQNGSSFIHTKGTRNTFMGVAAGNFTLTGTDNCGFGNNALNALTSGNYNVAFGRNASRSLTSASYTLAIGHEALYSLTTQGQNMAIGFYALRSNTTGSTNIGIGYRVLYANTTGENNVAIGDDSQYFNLIGNFNVSVGATSLNNSTGDDNTAIGDASGAGNQASNRNTYLGSGADGSNGLNNSVALGAYANIDKSNQIVFGDSSGTKVINWKVRGIDWVMPSAQGAATTVLKNDGSGNLTWVTPASIATTSTLAQILAAGRTVDATGIINESGGLASINFNSKTLIDNSVIVSLNYNSRFLNNNAGTNVFQWNLTYPQFNTVAKYAADYSGSYDARSLVDKNYVDNLITGLTWKTEVACATTANITLSGEQTIDGVLTSASRVLVKNQSTASQNGLYLSAAGAWSRVVDADTGAELVGATVMVADGTTYANTQWTCSNTAITIGVTSVTFAQISGAGTYTADGTSIQLSGNVFSIKSTWAGQNTITTLGTIITGVWNGTTIANSYIATALSSKTYEGLTVTATTGTLTLTNAKTLSVSNTLTFTGTDGSSVAFGTGGTVVYTNATTLSSLVSIGTITTGTWNGTVIANAYIASALSSKTYEGLTFTGTGGSTVAFGTGGTVVYAGVTTLSSLVSIGTITTGVWNGTKVSEIYGGTNQAAYTTGDTLYASGTNTLSKLAIGTSGQVLTVTAGVPAWSTISTGITIGTTAITGGTTTRILYNSAGVVGEYAVTGTGTTAVLSTTPTFTTSLITPIAYGSTAANGSLSLIASSNGTLTTSRVNFLASSTIFMDEATSSMSMTGSVSRLFVSGQLSDLTGSAAKYLVYFHNSGGGAVSGLKIGNYKAFSNTGTSMLTNAAHSDLHLGMGEGGNNYSNFMTMGYWPSQTNNVLNPPSYFGFQSDSGLFEGSLLFGLRSAATDTWPVERMRLTKEGRLGIGLTPTASLHLAGNYSATTWTTTGIQVALNAATYTDTGTAGTRVTGVAVGVGIPTFAGTNAVTITDAATFYIAGTPAAGTNMTLTNKWAAWIVGNSRVDGDFKLTTAGNGFAIKEGGAGDTMGVATLVGGTVVVNTTKVTANSRIFLTGEGGNIVNLGSYSVSARTAGTSFTILSSNILDTNTVGWIIIEPA